jgi:hypothetical protein
MATKQIWSKEQSGIPEDSNPGRGEMRKTRLRNRADLYRGMRKAEHQLSQSAELLRRGNLTTAQKLRIRKASAFADAVIDAMTLQLKTRRS